MRMLEMEESKTKNMWEEEMQDEKCWTRKKYQKPVLQADEVWNICLQHNQHI